MSLATRRFSWRYHLAFPLQASLPRTLAYRCADWQSQLIARRRAEESAQIKAQMQQVFPNATEAELQVWLADYFCMVEQEALDTWFLTKSSLPQLSQLSGFEKVMAAREAGRKVILTSGHYGRFWLAGPAMRRAGFSVGTVTRDRLDANLQHLPLGEFHYRRWKLQRLQQALGGPFLVEGDNLRKFYSALNNNLLTLIFDVPYVENHSGRVTVPFLNGTIQVPAGIYRIAKKTQAVVAPFYMRDQGNGAVVAEFSELLEPENYNDEGFMSLLARQLEAQILARPGHWWLWAALPLLRRQYNYYDTHRSG